LGAAQNHLIAAAHGELHLVHPNQLEKVGLDAMLQRYIQPLLGEETLGLGDIKRRELHAGDKAQPQRHRRQRAALGRCRLVARGRRDQHWRRGRGAAQRYQGQDQKQTDDSKSI
jgi:hypothetical protein